MTFVQQLKTSTIAAGRGMIGIALGLGLAGAIALQPAQAFAQSVDAAAPAAAVREAPRAQGAGPALWVIRDADSTIYLFGTVHVLRPTTAWGTDLVDRAFDSADQVWLEISNPDDQAAVIPLIQQHGLSPDRPLSSLLSTEDAAELAAAAAAMGMPAGQIDMFRPWFAAMTLSVAPLVKAGYDPTSGVELVLKSRAQAAGKPIHGFETIDQQIRIFADMPEAEQLAFLRTTLDAYEDAHIELDRMVDAWATGDTGTLKTLSVDELKADSEVVYRALLADRNANWAGQIQQLLAGSGTVFIAVGAAHLVGEDSVQEILEDRGVTSERVE